jgi:uncharacterized ferritin-like protein (DUF455 family)
MELRASALKVLCISDPCDKVQALQSLWAMHTAQPIQPDGFACNMAAQGPDSFGLFLNAQTQLSTAGLVVPGRPDHPRLCPPQQVPTRSVHTDAGLAAMVHAICHIEFNAINLALDAIWRYPDMPTAYYLDWFRVAYEESTHFVLLQDLLQQMDHAYGDFEAHDGLWAMCEKTADDVLARMALVPRTLEARGLDATPLIQSKLNLSQSVHAKAFKPILDTILHDEVGHVAIGNHWFRWLCAQQQRDPLMHYPALVKKHTAPRLKPPFNQEARLRAGFTQEEIDWLMAQRV